MLNNFILYIKPSRKTVLLWIGLPGRQLCNTDKYGLLGRQPV
ncbi:40296_t:CDS:2 [Gigaspora margarita]|uniref:40296_t:CDS:1 n=1 Tax=Gigaspora margarita TaxID=4874 RepID=A0ABM8W0T8_GIGMA|nr:40296_t:CDS:2 [Gigaspora margarita]